MHIWKKIQGKDYWLLWDGVLSQSDSLIGDNKASPAKVYQNCLWKACHNKTLFSWKSPLVQRKSLLSYRDKQNLGKKSAKQRRITWYIFDYLKHCLALCLTRYTRINVPNPKLLPVISFWAKKHLVKLLGTIMWNVAVAIAATPFPSQLPNKSQQTLSQGFATALHFHAGFFCLHCAPSKLKGNKQTNPNKEQTTPPKGKMVLKKEQH